MAVTLIYWDIVARATPGYFTAALANIEVKWDSDTANSWPADKPNAPFGQLPYLKDGDLKIAQSMAIVRYLGRKGGIQGDDIATYGVGESLIEEAADLINAVGKAKYSDDPLKAYNEFFESLSTHAANLAKLLKGPFFSGEKALQGDAALYSAFYLISRLNGEKLSAVLNAEPKLKEWYAAFGKIESIAKAEAALNEKKAYFTWPEEK
mgnify:CR=1 FL=1